MAQDSRDTALWRDKLRVWVARTGWRPADVALQNPRAKTDLSDFKRYDPKMSRSVSLYCFFQLVAVVLLLGAMQSAELAYWHGVAGWSMLLATAVTTALWMEGRAASALQYWELLRLGALGLLLLLFWSRGVSLSALSPALVYAGLNAAFLLFWLRPQPLRQSKVAS
jgi:alkylglycerol monooxygenase|tara:strand:- start:176 stop:676 length:501 start_codon:yes stop_codon:yes gene_type:complete